MELSRLASYFVLLLVLGLNALAIWRVYQCHYYSRSQRIYQTRFILCLPIMGASLALYLSKDHAQTKLSNYPEENYDAENVGQVSNYDVTEHS